MIMGLKRALMIIEEEKKFAVQVNPQMAMGMSQIESLIKKEINKLKGEEKCLETK